MKIFVLNSGSSSLRYQLLNMEDEKVLAQGYVERIGIDNSFVEHKTDNQKKVKIEKDLKNHKEALELVLEILTSGDTKVISDLNQINGIGHRVVHGAEKFSKSVIIDQNVIQALNECIDLAPLHNPANITGIQTMQEILPNTPQVAVFDTAFHQTMPESSYIYSIPYEYYKDFGIRKYGFHGTSHKFVSQRAAQILGKDLNKLNIISCHLGNGGSLCAIKEGKSIDTTMGLTPLDGLTMGTRCGDIDPGVITFLKQKLNVSSEEVISILNKKSGMLGISGISSDARDIEDAAFNQNNKRAQLALDKYHNVVKKYIGSYMALMDGVDAIIFTAGIGENGIETREEICSNLSHIGIEIDIEKNKTRKEEKIISTQNSKTKILIIPTNEELVIAKDTKELISN